MGSRLAQAGFSRVREQGPEVSELWDREGELLAQGGAMPRGAMLKLFRKGGRCVLLGTMSFWQGVDVAGDAEQLPFAGAVFQRVECDAVLEHVRDPVRAAGELRVGSPKT